MIPQVSGVKASEPTSIYGDPKGFSVNHPTLSKLLCSINPFLHLITHAILRHNPLSSTPHNSIYSPQTPPFIPPK